MKTTATTTNNMENTTNMKTNNNMKTNYSKSNQYDIIGDVHGNWDKLEPLLTKLGYHHDGLSHVHPEGRIALFLGNLVNFSDIFSNDIRQVLHCVRDMVISGRANCILGNYEYNFVASHTPDGKGGFLRPHNERDNQIFPGTRADIEIHPSEIKEVWLPWFKTLPFYLDLPELRIVHACWHPEYISLLDGKTLTDDELLPLSVIKGTPEHRAIETLLNGLELPLPDEHQGNERTQFPARWWDKEIPFPTVQNMYFPPNGYIPGIPFHQQDIGTLPGYNPTEKPVFFGNYFKPTDSPLELEAANVCCLDFSAANGGPLAAYRFDGPQYELNINSIVLPTEKEPDLNIKAEIEAFLKTKPGVESEDRNAWDTFEHYWGRVHYHKPYYDLYLEWVTHVLNQYSKDILFKAWLNDTDEGVFFLRGYQIGHGADSMPSWDDHLAGDKLGSMPSHYLDSLRQDFDDMARDIERDMYYEKCRRAASAREGVEFPF